MGSFHPVMLLLFHLIGLVLGLPVEASPYSQVPFLSVWNAPTTSCLTRYGVNLDLGTFNILNNPTQVETNVAIFYANMLGLYPRYVGQDEPVNGGVPQNASLDEHLRVAYGDIHTQIPQQDFKGLAVVDWESWRPVWERNWDSKRVYWEASKALVKSRHRNWSPAQINAKARVEFEEAGRNFMAETLKLGQEERPSGLWGFYGFPDCYNEYKEGMNYSGECPAIEKRRNDELLWLWKSSTALYPDIYLSLEMRGLHKEVALYSRHRILEGMRAAAQVTPSALPVFPYARIVYTYTLQFLPQEHLVYTIGESAALGSAGVVLWGNHDYSRSEASCNTVRSYIDETLGPYLVNVTSAATLCSQTMCSSHGRCQRRDPNSRAYLHLDPAMWKVVSEKKPDGRTNYRVLGQKEAHKVMFKKSEFQCRCYPGWGGESCAKSIWG